MNTVPEMYPTPSGVPLSQRSDAFFSSVGSNGSDLFDPALDVDAFDLLNVVPASTSSAARFMLRTAYMFDNWPKSEEVAENSESAAYHSHDDYDVVDPSIADPLRERPCFRVKSIQFTNHRRCDSGISINQSIVRS
jgi:hypothetical protein